MAGLDLWHGDGPWCGGPQHRGAPGTTVSLALGVVVTDRSDGGPNVASITARVRPPPSHRRQQLVCARREPLSPGVFILFFNIFTTSLS